MKVFKKICVLLLCLAVIIGIFPISAFAGTITVSEQSVSKFSSNYMYFFSAGEEIVYCVNRGQAIGPNYNKDTNFSDAYWNGLPNGVRKGIMLALLYGYPGFGSDAEAARAATQALIWDIQKCFVFGSSGVIGEGNSIGEMMHFWTFHSLCLTDSLRYDTIYKHVQNDATSTEFTKFRDHYLLLWNKVKAHGTTPVLGGYTAASTADSAHVYTIPSSNTLSLTDSTGSFYFAFENAYDHTVLYVDTTPTFEITYSNTADNEKISISRDSNDRNKLIITQRSPLIGTATIKINKGSYSSNSRAYIITHNSDQQLVGGKIGYDLIPTYIKVKSSTVSNKFTLQKEADCSTPVKNELSGNPMYSLAGAEYHVFDRNGVWQETLTTDSSGKAVSSGAYPAGTVLSIRENDAPPGYKINPDPVSIEIKASSSQNTFIVKDEPVKDPINLRIYKVDKQDNAIFLQGAVFKLQYYAQSSLPTSSSTPTRTWYLKSDANGLIQYTSAYLASGYSSDALYNGGQVPLGYIKITEEQAPAGYAAASNTTFYYHIYQSSNGLAATHEWLNSSGNSLTTSGNIVYKSNGDINILNDGLTNLKIQKTFASGSTGSLAGWGFLQFPANYNASNAVAVESFISTNGECRYQDIGYEEQFHDPVYEIFHVYINGEEVGFWHNDYKDGSCVFNRAPNIGDTVTVVFATVNAANYVNLGTTNASGQIARNANAGTYTIVEVPQFGYAQQSPKTVTVTNSNTPNNPATVTFVNQQTTYLKIYKRIAAGSSGDVTGWQFNVYQGNAFIGTYTTNTTETVGGSVCGVVATNIAAGTYRIEEVTKNGWVAQPSQTVTVTSSNTPSNPATVTFTNEQIKLKIQKTFASGSTGSLAGWWFLQFPANYNTSNVVAVESFISTDGCDDYQDIGHEEQFHNSVYEIFHVYINGEEVGFSNDHKYGDCVFNRAPNVGDTVTVVFATVNAANYVNLGATNASGQIVRNANAGTYTIVEVPKFGYVQQSPKTVTVTNSNTPSNPATVTFVNQQEPNFKIYKSIAANSTGSVTGWQFKVYRGSTLINTYTTAQTEVINGVTYGVITTLLPVGTYRVEEVAKDGWVAQPAQTVTVTNANSANNPASVSFENEKLSVHLEKQYTESGLSNGYSMVTFLSSENQNLLGEHCYSTVTVSLTQNISAASASSDIYIGTDRLTDRSRSTNTVAYGIKTSGKTLVRYIPEAVCYVLHNGRLLEPGRGWYVTTSDINHIRFASALSAGDTIQIIYLTQTVDGNAAIHHITSDNAVDAHNLTANKTYWFYEVPVPGYRANGDNPQSIQLHGNDNGQLTFINKPDVCGISIEKTTSDGSSVEGWAFNIYRDGDISRYDACTFNGTGAAAYNIPSISNDNHIDDVFAVYVNNSWYDNRHGDMFTYSKTTGTLTFLKAIPQLSDTVQIVYTRENYDDPYNDHPYITDEHGLITDDDLPEGIYNVEEIPTLGYLYQPPVTGVEVVAGQITAVDFHNVPTDTDIRIEKSFKDGTYGNKQGWEFAVIDVDEFGDLGVDHVFAIDSFIYDSATYSEDLSRMLPGHPNVCGIYSVYRNGVLLSDGHDYQVQGGELDIGFASVENGDEITVVYSPVIDMNYLYHSSNYHIISTNQYGIANVKNLTGEWFVEEIPQYGYLQQPVKNVSVYHKTTEYLNFENTRLAKIQVKKTDTSGYPLEGVQFILQYKGIHEDTWHDAVYSANRNGAAGTFYTDNNINNNKTILTDTNGCASFNCIAASTAYEYRLVETATTTDRNGRQLSLLAQPIEIGVLPKALEFSSSAELQTWLSQQNNVSDYVVNGNSVMQYTLHYTIANGGVTQMPFTGSTEMEKTVLTGSVMLAFAAGMLFIVCRKKREQE